MRRHGGLQTADGIATGQRANGFTLLEVLAALVVLSLIMAVAFGSVRLGSRSWEGGIERADATDQMRSVTNFLRNEFNQLLPFIWQQHRNNRIAFEGDTDLVRFIAPAPQQFDNSGLLVYTLSAQENGPGVRLVLEYALLDPGGKGLATTGENHRLVLVDGLSAISFTYYGTMTKAGEPAWHRQWQKESERYPMLIQLHLETDRQGLIWPDLLLSIRSEQPA